MRFLKPKDSPPRRRPLARRTRVLLRLATAAGLAAVLAVGGGLFWHSNWGSAATERVRDAALGALARAGMRVERIDVVGRRHTPAQAVLDAIGVTRGSSLFAADLAAARGSLERLPWVRTAAVRRIYPDGLGVTLAERRPVALWQRGRRRALVDEMGDVIDHADLGEFPGLVVVVGDDAPAHALDLVALLDSAPELRKRVGVAVRVGGRRWNIKLDNGVDVLLPESGARAAWGGLARLDREHDLLGQRMVAIDLRFPDRMIIRTSAVQPARKPRVPARGEKRT